MWHPDRHSPSWQAELSPQTEPSATGVQEVVERAGAHTWHRSLGLDEPASRNSLADRKPSPATTQPARHVPDEQTSPPPQSPFSGIPRPLTTQVPAAAQTLWMQTLEPKLSNPPPQGPPSGTGVKALGFTPGWQVEQGSPAEEAPSVTELPLIVQGGKRFKLHDGTTEVHPDTAQTTTSQLE